MHHNNNPLNRRAFLGLSLAGTAAAALAACSPAAPDAARILPGDPLIADYESRRVSSGKVINQTLAAAPVTARLNGQAITTWGYNGALQAPTLRVSVGDRLKATISNGLPEATSIHWHGLALRNNADGVHGLTEDGTPGGSEHLYDFKLPHPGTYWYHSHVEMQRERALYGALIIEDPEEALEYDRDWVIVLDDWIDGVATKDGKATTPDGVMKELSGGMGGMDHGSMGHGSAGSGPMSMGNTLMGVVSEYLGGDAGDVATPFHLFNGATSDVPAVLAAKAGERIRLRIINAAGDTAFRVGVPGQRLTLTHSDGFPVKHEEVDAVVLGMGERIDALVTVQEGTTPVLALAEGKRQLVHGLISTGTGTPPLPASLPMELGGTVLDGGKLTADPAVVLAARTPDRVHEMRLTGGMEKYDWGINGHRFDMAKPFERTFDIRAGERVQLAFINDTDMWHPMHLHGHTFQIGDAGARKDTVIVRPGETVKVQFDADNPGQWLTHCHNAYHAERGMMAVVSYIA